MKPGLPQGFTESSLWHRPDHDHIASTDLGRTETADHRHVCAQRGGSWVVHRPIALPPPVITTVLPAKRSSLKVD
jgi:hypothetical protein